MALLFKDKICLVVGGTKGIGLETAKQMYSLGAKVAVCSRNVGKVESDIKKMLLFKCDISNSGDVKKMVDGVVKEWGRIDFLIVAAGVFKPFGTFESSPFIEHRKTIEIDLIGAMNCCWEVIRYMKKQKSGRIILFSGAGIGGDTALENVASYYTAKGAISFFAEVLAAELKSFNIIVNSILPGQILTDLTRATFEIPKNKLGKVLYDATKKLKQGGQSMESVINLVLFLCSTKSKHITGKLISAKWDDLSDLSGNLPPWKYTLRRIEEKVYTRI